MPNKFATVLTLGLALSGCSSQRTLSGGVNSAGILNKTAGQSIVIEGGDVNHIPNPENKSTTMKKQRSLIINAFLYYLQVEEVGIFRDKVVLCIWGSPENEEEFLKEFERSSENLARKHFGTNEVQSDMISSPNSEQTEIVACIKLEPKIPSCDLENTIKLVRL